MLVASAESEITEYVSLSATDYTIETPNNPDFHKKNALVILDDYLQKHRELKQRLLDPEFVVEEEGGTWGYRDQCYGSEAAMRHLIAIQIKAMVELGALTSIDEVFDKRYGIGSKSHKDKGTIKDVFSLWGHPVRDHILKSDRGSTRQVYDIFRKTLKNPLKQYARTRSLAWHHLPNSVKLTDTLTYLETYFREDTETLRELLQAYDLELRVLILRTIETHLLS